MLNRNNYAIIMAGGVGSRFWPVSTKQHPKQFLDILGTGKSLIRQTYERFARLIPPENIYVVTNSAYIGQVKDHLPELNLKQIIGEPSSKNTAACIAYAMHKVHLESPGSTCIVAPSDHLILDETEFLRIVGQGMNFCHNRDALLCIGIKPHRPDTGYGYIQYNESSETDHIHKVKTFTEKPNVELANKFIESGDFLWNAGIFIWNIKAILAAFQLYMPEMEHLFTDAESKMNTAKEDEAINEVYQLCTNISIDYGVLEKAPNVFVHPGEFGWSDLGTWASLYDVYLKDKSGNAVNGRQVQLYEADNCMVCVPDDKLVVLNGVSNLIVVESDKALLICDKSKEQDVKQIVTDMKLKYGEKYS